jgi:hypothetical protein
MILKKGATNENPQYRSVCPPNHSKGNGIVKSNRKGEAGFQSQLDKPPSI